MSSWIGAASASSWDGARSGADSASSWDGAASGADSASSWDGAASGADSASSWDTLVLSHFVAFTNQLRKLGKNLSTERILQ